MLKVNYIVPAKYETEDIIYFVNKGKESMERYNKTDRQGTDGEPITLAQAVADELYYSMDELRYSIPTEEFMRVAQEFINSIENK